MTTAETLLKHTMNKKHTNGKEINGYATTQPASSVPELTQPPAVLSSSVQMLSFEQTDANKPSFRLFAVSQQPTGLPLTLTTDAPAYFQLAADDNPRFSPALTLTPSTNTTYIHVQYLTAETGPHTGQLTVTNGQQTIDVALTGQRRRRGLRVSRPLPNGQPAKSGAVRSRAVLLVASLSLVAGAVYFAFSGKPSSSSPSANSVATPPSASAPKADPVADPVSSAKTAVTAKKERTVEPIRKSKTKVIVASEPEKPVSAPVREPELVSQKSQKKPEPVVADTRQEVAKPKETTRPRSNESTKLAEKVAPAPAPAPTPPAAESELERVLNQPPQ